MAENENNGNTPAKVVGKHFPVTVPKALAMKMIEATLPDSITVEVGINEDKGNLNVYSYTADGIRKSVVSQGRFPVSGYSSQWRDKAIIVGAVLAFIAHDSQQPNPQLTVKTQSGTQVGEGLSFTDEELAAFI